VGTDDSGFPFFEPDTRNYTTAAVLPLTELEVMVMQVDGRLPVYPEDTPTSPLCQGIGGTGIPVVADGVLWKLAGELESDGVVFTPGIKLLLLLGGDDVVWWTDNPGEVTDQVLVIVQTAKGKNISHAIPCRLLVPVGSGQFSLLHARRERKREEGRSVAPSNTSLICYQIMSMSRIVSSNDGGG
jgi:hypothetical protein